MNWEASTDITLCNIVATSVSALESVALAVQSPSGVIAQKGVASRFECQIGMIIFIN